MSGAYAFDPATLMQRRPEDKLAFALVAQSSLHHERAHWFQFCGSTIGSALLTLLRAQDVALLTALAYGHMDGASQRHIKQAATDGKPILDGDLPSQLSELADALATFRWVYALLLSGHPPENSASGEEGLRMARGLLAIEATYAIHTGGSRDWRTDDPLGGLARLSDSVDQIGDDPRPALTTRHLFEAGALLNELGNVLALGHTTEPFAPLPRDFEAYVGDRLAHSSAVYTLALTSTLEIWQEHIPNLRGATLPNCLAWAYPALACCLDIAVNPPIGPISPLTDEGWAAISPPWRYHRAVNAVSTLGLPSELSTNAQYADYRSSVLESSGLTLGGLDHRSTQHPRFSGDFFCSVTAGDPLLPQTTHFDYLVWAMEGMHAFRAEHALTWAMPQLMSGPRRDGLSLLQYIIDPEHVWSAAPLYWFGTAFGTEARLSEAFGVNLAFQLMVVHLLRQTATHAGRFDLSDSFPGELLGKGCLADEAIDVLVRTTEIDGLKKWIFVRPQVVSKALTPPESWRQTTRVKPTAQIHIDIARGDVESLNDEALGAMFEQLRQAPMQKRFSLQLRFSGYDANPLGLWDIADVRAFMRQAQDSFPFWPWYLAISPDPGDLIGPMLFLVSQVADPRRVTLDEYRAFLATMFDGLNLEAARVGLTEPAIEEMSLDIRDAVTDLMRVRLG